MKLHLALLWVVFLEIHPAHARLGETIGQCVDRYGAILDTEGDVRVFQKSGFRITVNFHEGKADTVIYRRENREGGKFSENEIQGLLNNNAPGGWVRRKAVAADPEWESRDGKCVAFYARENDFLVVSTTDALQRSTAAKKATEDKLIKGL